MSIIKKLIPSKFHQVPKLMRSLSLIVLVNLLITVVSPLVATFFFNIGFSKGAYILAYSSLGTALFFVLLNVSKNLMLCGIFFTLHSLIVSLSLMSYTGGVGSPFLLWLFGIGPVSFLYFKKRLALFWTFFVSLCLVVMAVLQSQGFPFEQQLPEKYFYGCWVFMFSFLVFIFVKLIMGFQSGLKKSNWKLKKSNQELERFAYIASHDLKSPLRNINNFINLFNRKYIDVLDENGKEYLQIISTNAQQMQHLIEDILEYSQNDMQPAKKEKVDLNKILNQLSAQISGEGKYQDYQIDFTPLPILNSDFTRVKQVFQNLVENGLKYNTSDLKKVTIEFSAQKNTIHFLIKDNGIGIKAEYHDRIFEMFQRLHNTGTYEGTGIGLAICKKSVLLLGGAIAVTSTVDVGSIFELTFPKTILWKEKVTTAISIEETQLSV
ncbi:MAG: ATP-binding protein [Saprospiraceae bacterium]